MYILFFVLKGQRLYDENEPESLSITCSGNSEKRYNESEKVSNSSGYGSQVDMDNRNTSYARNEEGHNSAVHNSAVHLRENGENTSANRHMDIMKEIGRMQDKEKPREKKNNNNLNDQSTQNAIGK